MRNRHRWKDPVPSGKGATQKAGKAAADSAGKPGQPKKASPGKSGEMKSAGTKSPHK